MSHQDTLARRISLLQNVPLLRDLKEEDLARMVGDFQLKSYEKDEMKNIISPYFGKGLYRLVSSFGNFYHF